MTQQLLPLNQHLLKSRVPLLRYYFGGPQHEEGSLNGIATLTSAPLLMSSIASAVLPSLINDMRSVRSDVDVDCAPQPMLMMRLATARRWIMNFGVILLTLLGSIRRYKRFLEALRIESGHKNNTSLLLKNLEKENCMYLASVIVGGIVFGILLELKVRQII